MPIGIQRAVEMIQVAHSVPWEMRRSGEEFVDFLVGQSHLKPYASGDGFAGHTCKRHIYSVEYHPVYFFRPAFPVPVRGRVSEGAYVQEISVLVRAGLFFLIVRPT